MRLFFGMTVFLLCTVTANSADFRIAQDGKAVAEIMIEEEPHPAVHFAASELRHWVEAISGAKLPIVRKESGGKNQIILAVNPVGFEDDLKKLKGNDGYAVRTKENTLKLIASQPKGILNGIFKLLTYNTDIIWARPGTDFGTIYTETRELVFKRTDYIDIPAYTLRGWQMIGTNDDRSDIWQVRNGNNWSARFLEYRKEREQYGMIHEYGGGHNIVSRYMTQKKYFAKHPEYYPLKDGKRLRPSDYRHATQLCFTNPGVVKAFIDELDRYISKNPNYDTYRIMIEDNWLLCECPECMKDILLLPEEVALPDGKRIIDHKDERFRSTQFFLWLNRIARHMKNNYPEKNILAFGYFFTEPAPYCKVEPNIHISFCPILKNSKFPMQAKENDALNQKFRSWLSVTPNITMREYFGLTGPFPRPVDAIALADWRYANKHGVTHSYSEMRADNIGLRRDGGNKDGRRAWNLNAPYFWTMTWGMWNPYVEVDALRREYFTRVFGAGWEEVKYFYALIEKGWHKAGGKSDYRDQPFTVWRSSVVKQENVAECRRLLAEAAKKIKHPKRKKMLDALQATFEFEIHRSCNRKFGATAVRTRCVPEFDPDFSTGAWLKAKAEANFLLGGDIKPREKTAVKILYDNQNLYIGAKCYDKEPDKVYAKPAGQPRDQWPVGDKFEILLTGKSSFGKACYYQIAFDSNGNLYDGMNTDKSWDGKYKILCKTATDGWSAFITIPFNTLNVKLSKKIDLRAMFVRYWNHYSKNSVVSFWEGGVPHDVESFGIIHFK